MQHGTVLTWQCCWVVEWLVDSFNAVWLVIHIHLYSQGQMTVVHLFWTDVLSGATAQVSLLSFVRRRPHLFFPRSYSPWVLDREPLFSPWWAAIVTSVRPYYAEPDRLGHKARSPLPCGSFFPPTPSVQRLWWWWWRQWWLLLWVHSWLAVITSLVYTVMRPLLKSVSQEYLWLWIIRES